MVESVPHEASVTGKRTIPLGIDVEEAETAISEGTNPPETRAGSPRRGGWRWARDALFQREVQGLDTGQTCIYPLVDPPTTSAEHKPNYFLLMWANFFVVILGLGRRGRRSSEP